MRFTVRFAWQNLCHRSGRFALLLLFAVFFAAAVFGGTILISSMQRGMQVLESRLGADVVVMPASARTQFNINSVLLQGTPGYFYMDAKVMDQVAAIQGVERVSPQLFLASMTADCCSASLQIVGFDPATDFVIQPWIKETYDGKIEDGDIVIGCNVRFTEERMLKFFDVECRVVAQLAKTGSNLDNAVYANADTVRRLIASSQSRGMNQYNSFDPDKVISTVLVKVKEGHDIEKVRDDIKVNVRHIKAVAAKNLISDISSGLTGLADMIGLFVGVIWSLCVLIMMIVFTMVMNERKREFAVLRVMGTSRRMLAGLVVGEAMLLNLMGGVVGILLAGLVTSLFHHAIRILLGVPFLLPPLSSIALLAGGTLLASVLAGGLISALVAYHISSLDTSLILREGE
ncbi:MAG: ABC transporter permease [Schwartzia sp. (in: firmicutes)]